MKIIVPVKNKGKGKDIIVPGFMENEVFCIYDDEKETFEYLEISSLSEKIGNLSLALKQIGVSTILMSTMDIVELGLFTESGFGIYKAFGINLNENLDMLKKDLLHKITVAMALGLDSSSCSSSSCSSCSSCH